MNPGSIERAAFVVGAPRCGTTTIAAMLRQHPEICFSRPKEPHFFSRHDLRGLGDDELHAVAERYVRRFYDPEPGNRMIAEASPTSLYLPEQMEPILRIWTDARFIITVRNPLDMLPSLHARLLVTGDEVIRDFARAWAMTGERAAGRHIPRSCIEPRWLRYDEAAAFGTRVEAFCSAVGRQRCHIVVFDDLVADPQGTYGRICTFLRLEPHANTSFEHRRGHKVVRIGALQRLLNRPPVVLEAVLASDLHLARVGKRTRLRDNPMVKAVLKLRKRILTWNEVRAPRETLDPALSQEIAARYRGEIERLGRFLDRDLSHWLEPPERQRAAV